MIDKADAIVIASGAEPWSETELRARTAWQYRALLRRDLTLDFASAGA